MYSKFALVFAFFISSLCFASSPQDEFLYNSFQSSFYGPKEGKVLISGNESLYVDALWDSLNESVDAENLEALKNVTYWSYPIAEKLRLGILKLKFEDASELDAEVVSELENILQTPSPDSKVIYLLAAHEKLLLKKGYSKLIDLAKRFPSYSDISEYGEVDADIEADIVSDLYFNSPDVASYMGGEYSKSVKMFLFCQYNRLYPCIMVMRDVNGQPVRNTDGSLWIHRSLASAITGLPSFERNGNTPSGIFTIDSVMPDADQQISYGQFRRMILNFIPKSADETLIKSILPKSSWSSDWWKPTTVARDIGRNLFRLHGTGRKDNQSGTPYFPFSRTHGCISQRENTYEGVEYKDQRNLLDKIMTSLGLQAKYSNEPKIKGILYVVDLNDRNAPLIPSDLEAFGIQ